MRQQALRLAAGVVAQWLNADTSDCTGPELPCSCGQMTRYAGRHRKTFETVLGPLELERAYYHCASCQGGFCPRDQALGMEDFSLSPAVLRMLGTAASMVSFGESSTLLRDLAGVQVSAKQVERAAEALGMEIAADERQDITPVSDTPVAATLYLGIDGTGIPVRASERIDRPGKQPDGSAKTRECKVCTMWSAESRDEEGIPVRDAGSVSYTAAIESAAARDTDQQPSEFAARVWREASRRRFCEAPRQAVLGDGAPYNWNIAQELFPRATQILDRYHAKDYLSKVAKAIFGPQPECFRPWLQQRYDELDAGRTDDLLQALTLHASACEEARKGVDYIQENRQRMRYDEFHSQGLCTSTGVLEAGCKNIGASQAQWHALDRSRRQCHHRAPLLPPQRSLRELLGASIPAETRRGWEASRRTLTILTCTHRALSPWPENPSPRILNSLGVALLQAGRPAGAEPLLRRALESQRETSK